MTRVALTTIYGGSYFGAGGCSGAVKCRNCRVGGTNDNGFASGPAWVEVVDPERPARFYAVGSDCVDDDTPREWGEYGVWSPGSGWTTHSGRVGDTREARKSWLNEEGRS